jgi:hypothetical protein
MEASLALERRLEGAAGAVRGGGDDDDTEDIVLVLHNIT